ncbi:MAG TPA: hypothetical protein VFO33_06760 [Casimicrobiaceae bacterium]|nr:hypothetical protein [Casimicrobiaceae bacterium]
MTTDLTFSPGYVPGLGRTARRALPKSAVGAAAKLSPCVETAPPMTAEQRSALAALIHTPAGAVDARFRRDRAGAGVAWAVVTACALAWTLTIAAALIPEVKLATLDVPQIAMPHVIEGNRAAA